MLSGWLRRGLAKLRDQSQHLLWGDPTLPLHRLLDCRAYVIAVQEHQSLAVILDPSAPLPPTLAPLPAPPATYSSGRVCSLFPSDSGAAPGAIQVEIDLNAVSRPSRPQFRKQAPAQRYVLPSLLLNYTQPVLRDDLTILDGSASHRQQFIRSLLAAHSGPAVLLSHSVPFL
jgi:hypothetical protein